MSELMPLFVQQLIAAKAANPPDRIVIIKLQRQIRLEWTSLTGEEDQRNSLIIQVPRDETEGGRRQDELAGRDVDEFIHALGQRYVTSEQYHKVGITTVYVHRERKARLRTVCPTGLPKSLRRTAWNTPVNLPSNGVKWYRHDAGGWHSEGATVSSLADLVGDAIVTHEAAVWGNGRVMGRGLVCGTARVHDKACVCDYAVVTDYAMVHDEAEIQGSAVIAESAHVVQRARVGGRAIVTGDALVRERAWVHDDAVIRERAVVCGTAEVFGDAILEGRVYVGGCHKVWGGRFCEPPFYLMGPAGPLFQGDENTLAFYRSYRTDLSLGGLVKMPLDNAEKARAILFSEPLGHWDDSLRQRYWQYVQVAYQLLGRASPTSSHQSTYRRRLLH